MRRSPLLLLFPFLLASISIAQNAVSAGRQNPTVVDDYSLKAKPRFLHFNKLSEAANTSVQAEAVLGTAFASINSVPHWSGSFISGSKKYSYTMIGSSPKSNATTTLKTVLMPVRFVFSAYKDASGNPVSLSPSAVVTKVKNSPNWRRSSFSSGYTQYGDAIQRAEFHKTMGPNWHTMLGAPRVLATATITVPRGLGFVYKTKGGVVFAKVDSDFYETSIEKVLSKADIHSGEFAIGISRSVFLYLNHSVGTCCVLGFHTSFQAGGTSTNPIVQTFAWASWLDKGIFANTDVADVMAISHEIIEWMDDPFVNNTVPIWEYPDNSGCQDNLEIADPIEVLDNISIPVTIDGYKYHPQTAALLQWFSREKPSSAIYGAYSYPDLSALRTPSTHCR